MATVKINIAECIETTLQSGKKIFKCKDISGVPYDSWNSVPLGEGEYIVTPNSFNPTYAANIKPANAPQGMPGRAASNPKRDALNAAVSFHQGNIASTRQEVIETAKVFEAYLKS